MQKREQILQVARELSDSCGSSFSSRELAARMQVSLATAKRYLDLLMKSGEVLREGSARATRYRLNISTNTYVLREREAAQYVTVSGKQSAQQKLVDYLDMPLAMRDIAGYQRAFVEGYEPNRTQLLPESLATVLYEEGRMRGQQPAGTYARKVLEQLLIDLSWSSSRLEGNRYTLLATEELFRSGSTEGDLDSVMLLNHKAAIEFMVDAVPEYGLCSPVIRNLHALLMQDLLDDVYSLGAIRRKVVNISDTTYVPLQLPALLEEMFELIIDKARQIKNPIEAAFFLWVNLAYLQPFEDGNKRTSRLSANIPLMLYNCAPLSFMDVEQQEYAAAMMGIYERCDVSLATELFEQVYRRSIKRYAVTLEAMGLPDPVRLQFRERLGEAMVRVVREGDSLRGAVAQATLSKEDSLTLARLLKEELAILNLYNCARYRLTMSQVSEWVQAGRPQ